MTRYDFSPLFRSTIGFDRLARMMDSALESSDAGQGYPPYNIETFGENQYRITIAVAGFEENDLNVEVHEQTLTVTGKKDENAESGRMLYRGIAGRNFQRKFQIADHVRVVGANLANGLLTIDLRRELPEALKPRTIPVSTGAPSRIGTGAEKAIEDQAA